MNTSISIKTFACDCDSNSSTISYDITWTTTGNKEIEFWFLPNNNIDCTYDYESYFVEVRAIPPGEPTDSDGQLVFCTTNETKTISINGLENTADDCYYHHKYDWIVPVGWSVIPINDTYEVIDGGIRTYSTEVNVTSQSTNLAMGSSGNYKIIVKSAPEWPYPVQSEGTIWIGSPEGVFTDPSGIPAIEAVRGETINLKVISNNGSDPDHLFWSTNDPNALNLIPGYNVCAVECLMSGYNYVYVKSSNSCGESPFTQIPFNVSDGDGGGGGGMMALVYPNPSSGTINLELWEKEANLYKNKFKDPFNVLIYNINGYKKLDYISNNRIETFNLHDYDDGIYVMKILYQDFIIHKNFILKKNTY